MESLTVAICTYNRAKSGFLKQAICSVINQSYKNMKILVYDNGSTDNTFEVVKEFCDNRLKYIKKQNNERDAFNKIIDMCETDLLVIFHDDDIMLPKMIEIEISEMLKHPNAAMVGQIGMPVFIDEHSNIIRKPIFNRCRTEIFKKNELIENNIKYGRNIYYFPTVMFRVSELNRHCLRFDMKCGPLVDWLFWLQINHSSSQIIGIQRSLIKYRLHSGSDSNYCTRAGLWKDSQKYLENWLLSIGYKCSGQMIDYFIASSLFSFYRNWKEYPLHALIDDVKNLEYEYAWRCSDFSFLAYALISSSLNQRQNITLSDYLRQRKYITQELDTKLGYYYELKLILKYIYHCKIKPKDNI